MTLPINPETKVGELLDAFPEAEAVLIELAPRFSALSNPVLRRTVARVTTLEQAARVGGLQVSVMVAALRSAFGAGGDAIDEGRAPGDEETPPWVEASAPVAAIDAEGLLDNGTTPVAEVSRSLAGMTVGQVLTIDAPFNPAPLVDAVKGKGHAVHVAPSDSGGWTVWVMRR